jgi:hypothetical protein
MEVGMLRLVAPALGALFAGTAQAADLPEPIRIDRPIQVEEPCADPFVLARIKGRFGWAEKHTWHRGFDMASLGKARFSDHPYFEPGIIERKYCQAEARMTDDTTRTVYFAIEIGQGFASVGNYVDFCVLGLDPWHVHDEACRAVR